MEAGEPEGSSFDLKRERGGSVLFRKNRPIDQIKPAAGQSAKRLGNHVRGNKGGNHLPRIRRCVDKWRKEAGGKGVESPIGGRLFSAKDST